MCIYPPTACPCRRPRRTRASLRCVSGSPDWVANAALGCPPHGDLRFNDKRCPDPQRIEHPKPGDKSLGVRLHDLRHVKTRVRRAGRSWVRLGPSGARLGGPGRILGRSGDPHGRAGGRPGRSWKSPGAPGERLGAAGTAWARLGSAWGALGSAWGPLRARLDGNLGRSLNPKRLWFGRLPALRPGVGSCCASCTFVRLDRVGETPPQSSLPKGGQHCLRLSAAARREALNPKP